MITKVVDEKRYQEMVMRNYRLHEYAIQLSQKGIFFMKDPIIGNKSSRFWYLIGKLGKFEQLFLSNEVVVVYFDKDGIDSISSKRDKELEEMRKIVESIDVNRTPNIEEVYLFEPFQYPGKWGREVKGRRFVTKKEGGTSLKPNTTKEEETVVHPTEAKEEVNADVAMPLNELVKNILKKGLTDESAKILENISNILKTKIENRGKNINNITDIYCHKEKDGRISVFLKDGKKVFDNMKEFNIWKGGLAVNNEVIVSNEPSETIEPKTKMHVMHLIMPSITGSKDKKEPESTTGKEEVMSIINLKYIYKFVNKDVLDTITNNLHMTDKAKVYNILSKLFEHFDKSKMFKKFKKNKFNVIQLGRDNKWVEFKRDNSTLAVTIINDKAYSKLYEKPVKSEEIEAWTQEQVRVYVEEQNKKTA